MSKSKSSRRWLDRHFKDDYVKRAQHQGYRSRAAFKLLEIQEKQKIIVAVREILDTKVVRVSPHFFNSESDILQVIDAIKNL